MSTPPPRAGAAHAGTSAGAARMPTAADNYRPTTPSSSGSKHAHIQITPPSPRLSVASARSSESGSSCSSRDSHAESSTHSRSSTESFAPAPTPFNTYFGDDVYADSSRIDPNETYMSTGARSEMRGHMGGHYDHDVSVGPSILSPTSTLPFSATTTTEFIPMSTRPVPAPPQAVRSVVISEHDPEQSLSLTQSTYTIDSRLPPNGGEPPRRTRSRFLRRNLPPKQVDRDTLRLQQLGYDAVLGRDYTFWSSLAISWLNIGTIQGTVFAIPGAYKYGGPVMMLVAWPISALFGLALVLVLGELASAYPVAGAMASWAWKCARGGVGGERYWGWVMGAIVLGGHVGNLILVAWQATTVIAGTMSLAFAYDAERWHKVLFYLAVVAVVGTVGSTHWGASSRYWKGAGIFGLALWFALCVALLATGVSHRDYSKAPPISTHFSTSTGWTNHGYVYLLGWQACTIASGSDASAHMAEETQNPSRTVPKAMFCSVLGVYVLGYISIILLFISVDADDALFIASQSFPVGHILEKAISLQGAITFCCLIIVVMCLQLQAQLQAASRFTWALARDRALPFSDTIKRTDKHKQPVIANWLVVALWAPFGCLIIGSASVIWSVVTVGTSTLSMLGYLIPVALYLFSNKDLSLEGRSSWSLRRWSRPLACIGAIFCLGVVIVELFPGQRPVTAATVSWGPVIVAGTLLISFITWKLYGDKHYSGPIRALTKWETGVEIDLDSTLHSSRGRSGNLPGAAPTGDGSGEETSLKLAVTPCYEDTVHTVEVGAAQTTDSSSMSLGEWQQASIASIRGADDDRASQPRTSASGSRTGSGGSGNGLGLGSATGSGSGSGSGSDWGRTRSRSSVMDLPRVQEDPQGEAAASRGSGGRDTDTWA